ncbi:Rhophilin, Rho GTPase binding protein [Podochytrium sp. JEL0797]|nr:Rhophilin, Rho GTPase binding protein [Podochytrium sp. JEL0797]
MACVLFNLAALYSQLACSQRLWTKDGKKQAASYFKKSAGVFMHVRDTHCQRAQIRLERTSDLTDQFLTASAQIMLAQSMECYYERANDGIDNLKMKVRNSDLFDNADKVSSPIMSKLAAQTADYYEISLRHAKEGIHTLTRQRYPRTWIQQLTAKSFIYAAVAHYHAPLALNQDHAMGERISRLTIAKNLATRASKSSKDIGGSVNDIVKGHLDLITTSLLLADSANFDRHNHPQVDSCLVSILQRPNEALVVPITFTESSGDLTRFSDIFAGFRRLEEELDVSALGAFAVEVVERSSRALEKFKKDIEAEIKSHTSFETESLKEILATNKTRAEAISEHIQIIAVDETHEPFKDFKTKLELIHISLNQHVHETQKILESTPASSLADAGTKQLHGSLCKALRQTVELGKQRTAVLRNLRSQYESPALADFHPLEWTNERLKAVIPALDPSREHLSIEDVVSEKRRESSVAELKVALEKLAKLKSDSVCKLEEIRNFVESMESIRDHKAIHTQKLRLKIIEESVESIKHEKEAVLRKISEVSGTVRQIPPKRQVEEESRKTIMSFEESIKAYKKFRSEITLEISESIKLNDEAEKIHNKAKDLKTSSGDASTKSNTEIQLLLDTQSIRLELVKPVVPKPLPSTPLPESELLKNINAYLAASKAASEPAKVVQQTSSQEMLLNILQFQMDRNRATTALNPTTIDPVNTEINQLLQRILNPLASAPAPTPVATPATPAAEKPKEDTAEVKTAKEVQKFEDMLHSLAITTQQEIIRLNKIRSEREVAVRDAAEAEGKRREEVERLSRKAAKVLGDVSMVGMGGLNKPPDSAYTSACYDFANFNSNANKYGIDPRRPGGNGGGFIEELKLNGGSGGGGGGPSGVHQKPPFVRETPQRILTYKHGDVQYDEFYEAQNEIPFAGTTPMKKSCSPSEEVVDNESGYLDMEISIERQRAQAVYQRYQKEADTAKREYLQKEQLANAAREAEEGLNNARNQLHEAMHPRSPPNNGNGGGGLTGIVHNFFHMQSAAPTNTDSSATDPRRFARKPNAPSSKMFPGGQPNTRVNNVHVPDTPLDSFFEAKSAPEQANPSLFAQWANIASMSKGTESGSDSSTSSRTPPTRKPVILTKPGMEDKSVQDMMESATSPGVGTSGKSQKKPIKKYDSGIGSETSKQSRKLGDISRVVKKESEEAVSHFFNGSRN